MYFYWRMMEELKYLGEILVFHDPRFKREYRQWVRKNQGGLALTVAESESVINNDFAPFGFVPCLFSKKATTSGHVLQKRTSWP